MATIDKSFGLIRSENGISKLSLIKKTLNFIDLLDFKLKLFEFDVCLLLAFFYVQHQLGLSNFILFKLVKLFFLHFDLILQGLFLYLCF